MIHADGRAIFEAVLVHKIEAAVLEGNRPPVELTRENRVLAGRADRENQPQPLPSPDAFRDLSGDIFGQGLVQAVYVFRHIEAVLGPRDDLYRIEAHERANLHGAFLMDVGHAALLSFDTRIMTEGLKGGKRPPAGWLFPSSPFFYVAVS